MAPFYTDPISWPGDRFVHLVWNSVRERTSKFARCGMRIQPGANYDRDQRPTCPECLAFHKRDEARKAAEAGER